MERKSMTTNGIYAVSAKIYSMLVPLMVYPYVFRALGVISYGKVSYVQSLIAYFTLLATLGINDYAQRECSIIRDDKKKLSIKIAQIFTVSLILTTVSFCLYSLVVIIGDESRSEWPLYLTYSFMIICSGLMMEWLFRTLERFDLVSKREIFGKTILLLLCFLFVKSGEDYVLYAFIVVLTHSFIPMFLNHFNIWTGKCGVRPKITKTIDVHNTIIPIFYLGLMTIGSQLFSSSDIILTKWLSNGDTNKAVGLYNSAILLPHVLEQLVMVVAAVIVPQLYIAMQSNDREKTLKLANTASNAMYLVVIPAVLTCLIFPEQLLFLLAGEEFLEAANALQIYSLVLITAIGITLGGTRAYVARKKEKKLFTILISMAFLNIILDFIFISLMGIEGAAIATVIANTALMVIELTLERTWAMVFTKEKFKYLIGGSIVASIYLSIKVFTNMDATYTLFVAVAVAGICYILSLYLMKETTLTIIINKINKKK